MIILGSTGSIGQSALKLAKDHALSIKALAAGKNINLLNKQIAQFSPKFVFIADENLAKSADGISQSRIFSGDITAFLKACYEEFGGVTLINAIVGFAGLLPSITSQKLGFKLALANKESLVAAGKFLDCSKITPIDSEHFGLKFLLNSAPVAPKKLIITASGGAFYKMSVSDLASVTPADALKHPTWQMGAKITIDSATMANKLFEIIEAHHLFCKNENAPSLDAIIEPSSKIHALIEFIDGSTTAHISRADMRLAIAHAIASGDGDFEILKPEDIFSLNGLCFEPINMDKYPIFSLKNAILNNLDLGAVINGANEFMVNEFLQNRCSFLDIHKTVLAAAEHFSSSVATDIDAVFELDLKAREFCAKYLKRLFVAT